MANLLGCIIAILQFTMFGAVLLAVILGAMSGGIIHAVGAGVVTAVAIRVIQLILAGVLLKKCLKR